MSPSQASEMTKQNVSLTIPLYIYYVTSIISFNKCFAAIIHKKARKNPLDALSKTPNRPQAPIVVERRSVLQMFLLFTNVLLYYNNL